MTDRELGPSERWYAVLTGPRTEWLADGCLRQQGYETLYLHYRDAVRHARRTVNVLRPYFPRYLFVALRGSQGFHEVNHTPGVSTIVYAGEDPLEVPIEIIEELRTRGDKSGLVTLTPKEKQRRKRFVKHQGVRIETGPFTGLFGVVSLDKGKQVRVWMDLFKGRVNVGFEPEQLSPGVRSAL